MTPHAPARRAGFTLIELLVVMTVIVVLTGIAVAVIPGALEQDRTTDAAATIRQHLMIAKARATREQNGRGIRFILDGGLTDPARVAVGAPGLFLSTEMQYIEAAPTIVPNPLGLTRPTDPWVDLTNNTTATLKNLPAGSEAIVVMRNDLTARWFPKLYCPELGVDSFGRTQRFEVLSLDPAPASGPNDWTLTLAVSPDPPPLLTLLGTGDQQRSYRFAIEPRSRRLLGEPNVPLPKNVCVDLNPGVSVPGARVVGNGLPIDFEVMFSPNGQVIDPASSGFVHLWVRDYTKVPNMLPLTTTPLRTYTAGPTQFQAGGEQQLVSIKAKSGAMGVFPVSWPDSVVGGVATYSGTGTPKNVDPYSFARSESNSP